MALNSQVGWITQPGSTGNQTYNLPASFDPKALMLAVVPATADGVVAHATLGVGFATDRGGTPQQCTMCVFAEDNVGTSDTYKSQDDATCLRLLDAAGATDLSVTFVEFTSTTFVLNWTNLHTTGSIRVLYWVLGGDDVLDAEAHDFSLSTGAGAFDVTLGSGFGHPNLVILGRIAEAMDFSGGPCDIGLGWGILAGDDRSVWWGSGDNQATEASFQRIDNNSALVAGANGTIETDVTLAAEAGFPTDGYELTKATSSFSGEGTCGLALKLSSDVTITSGEGTARTTSGDTDLAVGSSTPKALLLLHTRQTTANSTDTTSSDAALLGIGLVDGAGNEGWVGVWDDDGQATASVASSAQVDDKAIRYYVPSTDTLDAEADGTISGSNFRLTWGDPAPSAFLYEWLALGEAGGTISLAGAIASASTVTGALSVAKLLAAAVAGQSTVTGALTVTAGLSATVASASTVSGSLTVSHPLAGTVASASAVSGTLTVTAGLAGTVAGASTVTGTLTNSPPGDVNLAGAVAASSTVTGALTVTAALAGAVVSASTVTGDLTNQAPGQIALAGTIASTSTVSGALLVTKPLAGTVAAASVVTGNLTSLVGLTAAVTSTSAVAGALTIRHPLAGAISGTSTVAGAVVVLRPLAGLVAASSAVTATLTNQGPVTQVPALESSSVALMSESAALAQGGESTSRTGVLESISGTHAPIE